MNAFWMKTVWQLVSILSVLTILVYCFFYFFGMEKLPLYFPIIPIFYFLSGVILCFFFSRKRKKEGRISLKAIAAARGIKLIGVIILLLIGLILDKIHILWFVIIFVIYYIVYLLFETKVLMSLEKNKEKNT